MSKPRFSESRNEEPKEEQTIILNKYEEKHQKPQTELIDYCYHFPGIKQQVIILFTVKLIWHLDMFL